MLGDSKGYCQFLPPPLTDVTCRASLSSVRIYHGAHMLIKKQHPSAIFPSLSTLGWGLTKAAGRVNGPVDVQAGSLVLHAPLACTAPQGAIPEALCYLQAVLRN